MAHTQNLITVAVPFITILVLLLVGAGMRRWDMVTPEGARQMTGLVLNVSLPPLIFVTLASEVTPQELGQAPLLVAMGVVGPMTGYVLSAAIGRLLLLPVNQRATFQTAVAVTNTAFIGYPLCEALLGSRGLLYAVLYDVGLTAVMSTFSIWLLSRASQRGIDRRSVSAGRVLSAGRLLSAVVDGGWGGLLGTPMTWALVLGAAWGALGWPTPNWLLLPLRTLGQCTTPLALLTVGMLVQPARAESAWTDADRLGLSLLASAGSQTARSSGLRWQLTALTVARLIVAPALVWALVLLLKVERTAAAVIVLQTAVPSAVCTTALVDQYGGDSAFAAAGVVATTLLSLLTLPFWSVVVLGVGSP